MNVLQRWIMGTVQPDEITMLMFLAVVLHLVNHRMYESRLPLLIYARRTGFTGFAVILARFLYLDGGIRSGGIRVMMSIALSWFLAGVVGIVVWVMSWVYDDIVMTTLQSWQRSVKERRERFRRQQEQIHADELRRQQEFERQQQEAERLRQQQIEQERWERERPERERKEREEAERRETQRRATAERKAQINAIRYELQLLYDRLRPQLAALSEEQFQAYFNSFLTEDLAVDVYRERADQLKQTMLQLAKEKTSGPPVDAGLEDVFRYYNERKERLRSLDLDEDTRETLELMIDEERNRTLQQML
ncbi:MAG: hypothetical protein KDA91_25750 [Planctomycetaceae bacterium]|nr:hypothetical protein [Planctomycetaceae bacterium]